MNAATAPATGSRIATRIPSLREAIIAWVALGAFTLAIFITYARLPATNFYNVSGSGLSGGASRALVFLNFPIAFIAIALVGFAFARLWLCSAAAAGAHKPVIAGLTVLSITLCLVAGVPGVVQQSDLDAKPINAVPAVGVALAFMLTVWAFRVGGVGTRVKWMGIDTARAIVAGILIAMSVPWMLADLGVYADDIPLLDRIYMSKEIVEGHTLAAVHLGDHHGFNGTLFALTAIVLSRAVWEIRQRWLRLSVTAYLAVMFVYGVTNMLQDFWGEQLVKRGWLDASFPSVLLPKPTLPWLLMLLATVMVAVSFVVLARPKWLESA